MSAPENAVVDYYSTLGVPATASLVEIKQAYRVLVLALHPDKNPLDAITTDTKQVDSHARIQRIIEAYRTLSDEQSRETYDHHRQQEQAVAAPPAATPTIALTVDLDDCTPVYPTADAHDDHHDDDDDDPLYYTYPCRCSDRFVITAHQLENGIDVIQCNGCTERCRVEYAIQEDVDDNRSEYA